LRRLVERCGGGLGLSRRRLLGLALRRLPRSLANLDLLQLLERVQLLCQAVLSASFHGSPWEFPASQVSKKQPQA
jgi:hypothetical protein